MYLMNALHLYNYILYSINMSQFKDVSDIAYLTKGKRGVIYTGIYKRKKVAIKCKLPESKAIGRIENEAKWIARLNKHNIGPRLIYSCYDYFIYEFIEGEFIVDYIRKCSGDEAIRIIKNVFDQCFRMDKLGVNKEEMHHPVKHIIISSNTNQVVMLDFERARYTQKPKNVTQLCQFIFRSELSEILEEKGIMLDKDKIEDLCSKYKKEITEENLGKILNLLHLNYIV